MVNPATPMSSRVESPSFDSLENLPILYEDDKEADMGESNPHVISDEILHICLTAHLAHRPELEVFSNMNLYYQDVESTTISPLPYVSPDTMVVKPFQPLGDLARSYQIGRDGPAPLVTAEVLSERSWEQRDLEEKVTLYAKLGVKEYVLVDVSGRFLREKLLLKRLQPDGTWKDERDADGGVTSELRFRLIIAADGKLRVLDAATNKPYIRPHEAESVAAVAEERAHKAEERIRTLEAELEGLRRAKRDSSTD